MMNAGRNPGIHYFVQYGKAPNNYPAVVFHSVLRFLFRVYVLYWTKSHRMYHNAFVTYARRRNRHNTAGIDVVAR